MSYRNIYLHKRSGGERRDELSYPTPKGAQSAASGNRRAGVTFVRVQRESGGRPLNGLAVGGVGESYHIRCLANDGSYMDSYYKAPWHGLCGLEEAHVYTWAQGTKLLSSAKAQGYGDSGVLVRA